MHPQTREEVLRVAESLGYVRNLAAATLSSGRSWRIELVCDLDSIGGGFFNDFLRGAHAVLHPAGYSLTLSALADPHEAATHLERLHAAGAIDAVLFTNPTVHDHFPETPYPGVVLGRPAGGAAVPRVDSDNPRVGEDIARHLHALGHRRMRVLEPAGRTFAADRAAGMLATWRALGLDEGLIERVPVGQSAGGVAAALADFAGSAVVTMSDSQAGRAVRALRARGLRVPEDVSVVGMNDDLAPLLEPSLTSVNFNAPLLGEAAARSLLAALSGREVPPVTLVPHLLVPRHSTAAAAPSRLTTEARPH